jgi:uncharacterized membrane protein YgcG
MQTDPKFGGSGDRISAEEWLRIMKNRVILRQLHGEAAVQYYVSNLTGTAALKFDRENGDAYLDNPEALDDPVAWGILFHGHYGRSATPAEAVADWTTLRQWQNELPSEMFTRVRHSVRIFFEAVNGSRPAAGAIGAFALSPASTNTLELLFGGALGDAIETAIITVVEAESVATQARLDARTAAQILADGASRTAARTTILNLVRNQAIPAVMRLMYGDVLDNTSRSLILRTMQKGLILPECKAEAFRYLKDPTLSLSAMCKSMNAIAFNAKTSGGARINAIGTSEANEHEESQPSSESPAATKPAEDPWEKRFSDFQATMINAIAKGKGGGGNNNRGGGARGGARNGGGGRGGGNSGGSAGGSKRPPRENDPDKYCDWCHRSGHSTAGCWGKWKDEKKEKTSGN